MRGMQMMRWVMVGVALTMMATGCKSRAKRGAGAEGDLTVVRPSDVDMTGMPGERTEGGTELAGQFQPVYFDYDSTQINASERSKIEAVAAQLKSVSTGIIVEGHCDERGSAEYNLALGERRALAVRAYLVGLGVDGARVQTKSFGEENPVATGHDESAWSQNRRAEFVIVQ